MILAAFQEKLFRSDLLLQVNSDQEPSLIKCFDVTAYVLKKQELLKNIFSKQLLKSVHHSPPPLPLLSVCLTEKHKLLATHTNKFLAMAQGSQCRKRRYDITVSSPPGPQEDRRGERLREGGIERKRQQNRESDKEGGKKASQRTMNGLFHKAVTVNHTDAQTWICKIYSMACVKNREVWKQALQSVW